jgi:hypothetical protein
LKTIKRLFWDIETSPNIVLSWNVGYKINIDHENILHERAIICIGYKWEHEDIVRSLNWDAKQSDKAMLVAFSKIAEQADELVAHNGDSFDLPWYKTRCLLHGIQTIPDHKTVDTLQWARRRFYFNSNRLNYIARYMGLGGKLKTEFGLWKEVVIQNSRPALRRMVEYCMRDVVLLEKVWRRLSAHTPAKTHAGVVAGGLRWQCPYCGGSNVFLNKTRITARGSKQYQMRCNDDGRYFTIGETAYKAYQAQRTRAGGDGRVDLRIRGTS